MYMLVAGTNLNLSNEVKDRAKVKNEHRSEFN